MRYFLILLMLSLAACAPRFAAVAPGEHVVGGRLAITPTTTHWNRAPASLTPAKEAAAWTADGLSLNTILFYGGVDEGEPLFKNTPKGKEYPLFRADMLAPEIVELVQSSLALSTNTPTLTVLALQPATLSGHPGFQFDYQRTGADEVNRRGRVVGAVRASRLYLIIYEGADLHYYARYLGEVEQLISAARIAD